MEAHMVFPDVERHRFSDNAADAVCLSHGMATRLIHPNRINRAIDTDETMQKNAWRFNGGRPLHTACLRCALLACRGLLIIISGAGLNTNHVHHIL
jgi:hypothetical protein